MKAKPVIPRERANRDTSDAIHHYLEEGGQQTALGFIDALTSPAFRGIPGATISSIPGLS